MRRDKSGKGQAVTLLFTMLLFLVFVLCALFTVLFGSKVYENITARGNQNYTGSTALCYIANKVRQGDRAGAVLVREVDGVEVLELGQEVGDTTYLTWIYYLDGSIRELYADPASGLGLSDGLPILECDGLELEQEGGLIKIRTVGEGGGSLDLSLRSASGGTAYE